jgi:catechol 2,3-dioxygenase-like lactoylglutathione lyase family enzyme
MAMPSLGRLSAAPAKRLHYISFGIFAEDEAAFTAHLDAQGVTRIAPPTGAEPDGLWIEGFDGLPLNIRVGPKVTADSKSMFSTTSTGDGESGAIFNSLAPRTRPRRLSHFAIYTSDVIAATAWYERVLGLRLSDGSGPLVAFLHGAHGSDHHLLALVASSHRGLHHISWDVGSVQEVGLGLAQMFCAGYKRGLGRGPPRAGRQLFLLRDRSLGQPLRIFGGYRFHPRDMRMARQRAARSRRQFLSVGPRPARRVYRQS